MKTGDSRGKNTLDWTRTLDQGDNVIAEYVWIDGA
jgi:glutamine synthetase